MLISLNSSLRKKTNILVLLLFVSLSLAMTYPLILNFRTHVPGVPGDNYAYLWKIWWFKKAIVDLHRNPLFAPQILYPLGFDFARDEATISNTLFSVPLTVVFGHITSYNLMLLLTYILAGFGMYLLVFYLTGSTLSGIVSGAIFAFSPYHQMRALQHLNLATIQWIPFVFLYLEKFLRQKTVKYAALAGVFYALTALAAWYYAYYVGLTLAIYLAIRLFMVKSTRILDRPRFNRGSDAGFENPAYPKEEFFNSLVVRTRPFKTLWKDRKFWKGVLVFFTVSSVLVLPFAVPSFRLHSTGVMKYKLIDVDTYSASLEDFFVPASFHSFWGKFFHRSFGSLKLDWSEHMLYLGIVPLLLAAFAVRKRRQEHTVLASAWLVLITFVLALGTTFHLLGERVLIKSPKFLKSFTAREAFPIPLPMFFFFSALPFISSTRVWSRFGLMTMFFVALLAGWGTSELAATLKKRLLKNKNSRSLATISCRGRACSAHLSVNRQDILGRATCPPLATPAGVGRRGSTTTFFNSLKNRFVTTVRQVSFKNVELLVGLVLVFLVLLEFTAIPLPMSKIEPRPVDIWLAKMKEEFTILQLPDATQGPQLLYTIYHKKRIANGCGAFLPPQFNVDLYGLKTLPDADSVGILRRMSVRYLLLNREKYGKAWEELSARIDKSQAFEKAGVFGEIAVFKVLNKEGK